MEMDSLLNIRSKVEQMNGSKVLIVTFSGKINSDNVLDINQKIKNVFNDRIYNVILDISSLGYINSTGIALLLSIQKTIEQNNGKLYLTPPSQFVQDLFNMTDLTSRFNILESVEKALEEFR